MPNHVINRLTFDCPEDRLKQILSEICYDNNSDEDQKGIGTIDFNKITPMPESLNIECGSNTDDGINLYLTSINPSVDYFGTEKLDRKQLNGIVEKLHKLNRYGSYETHLSPDKIKSMTKCHSAEELLQLGKTAVENLLNHGALTWYDWRNRSDTWNTKWNSYDSEYDGDNKIEFHTAWDAPHPIIKKLSEMYPDVTITHEWANEDIWQSCGIRTYLGGEIIDEIIPETDKEQIETATSLWGCEPIDYGLIENAAENSYISIDKEYELVNICGKPALFSSQKLTESDIPKGVNLYHLRSGGSLIMREELDIESGGRIADVPDFTRMYVDLGHFIYDDYENTEDLSY